MIQQPIPFLDLITPHQQLEDELVDALRKALHSAQFIGGPQVEAFEREFASYCGTAHSVAVSSGTDALRFALMASGVGPGDAVVTVAHTFIATVRRWVDPALRPSSSRLRSGPTTCVRLRHADYLAACQKEGSTGRPLGSPDWKADQGNGSVRLYGQVANMDTIMRVAEQHRLMVIEDACGHKALPIRPVGASVALAR